MEEFNELFEKKQQLEYKKNLLIIELDYIEKELILCNHTIYNKCVENGGHCFRKERDYKLYGEITFICEKCNFIK